MAVARRGAAPVFAAALSVKPSPAKARRVFRIGLILEKLLGTPRQSRKLPRPLDMLIATILSQNTSDVNSHRAFTRLTERYRDWQEVARAPVSSIRSLIKVGGMANQKSVRIRDVLRVIHHRYGEYSLDRLRHKGDLEILEELTGLNGVGVKTAACVLLFSLGRDRFPVDTHVHRICNRLGLVQNCPTPEKTFWAMQALVPEGKGYSFHTNLIRFGRLVCRSSSPACDRCPLFSECRWPGRLSRLRARRQKGRHLSRANHHFMLLDNIPA